MLNLSDIAKKTHIAVATPCYGGWVGQNYFTSIIDLMQECNRQGIAITFLIRGGDSLIPRTRNSIVAEFMANDAFTHLLWIDADIGFKPLAMFRLLLSGLDVAAGVYPMKRIDWPDKLPANMTRAEFEAKYCKFPFNPKGGATISQDGFVEVFDAPTGFMMIRREVLFKMKEQFPELKILMDDMPGLEMIADTIKDYNYRFFDVMTEPSGRYLSEDYAFCRRWQACGGQVHVDITSNLTHYGGQLFTGNFLEHIRTILERNT